MSPGRKSFHRCRKIKIEHSKSGRLKRRRNYQKTKRLQEEEKKKEQLYGAVEF